MELILIILALTALIIGSYTDFKIREIADWISFGLVFSALGVRLISSLVTKNPFIFVEGLWAAGLMFGVSAILFYTGQWGGGDAKLLIGMGAIIGIPLPYFNSLKTILYSNLVLFFFAIIFCGAIFSLLFSVYLIIINYKKFKKEFIVQKPKNKLYKISKIFSAAFLLFSTYLLIFIDAYIGITAMLFSVMFFCLGLISVILKAVENSSMIIPHKAKDLVEGDWIDEPILLNNKTILKKKVITLKDLILIQKHNFDNVKLKVKKRFFNRTHLVPLTQLSENMFLVESFKSEKFKLPKGKLSEKDIQKLDMFLRKHHFDKILVTRKVLGLKIHKHVHPFDLKVGDKLEQPITSCFYVAGPNDLGLEKYQIAEIVKLEKQKLIKKILVKDGVPFIPAFLLGYIVMLLFIKFNHLIIPFLY